MPTPHPAYHPVFAPADVAALERIVRKPTLAYRVVQRAKLALLLHRQPALANTGAAWDSSNHERRQAGAVLRRRGIAAPMAR